MLRTIPYVLLLVAGAMLAVVPVVLAADPPAKPALSKAEGPDAAGSSPKPLVIKFKNIPAASFVQSLHELGRANKPLAEGLAKIPISVNEASNAVVIIAPPDVAEMLSTIAKGLDTPNDFRAAQREAAAKDAEQRLKMDEERKKAGLPVGPERPAARPEVRTPALGGEARGPGMQGRGQMQRRGAGPMGGMMGQGRGMMERQGPGMMGQGRGQMQRQGPGMMGQGPMGGMMRPQGPGMMGPGMTPPQGPGMGGPMGQGMRGMGQGMGQGMGRRGPPWAEEVKPPAPAPEKGKAPPAPPAKKAA